MKCKYKVSDFKKGQVVMFYRHKNKLYAWSAVSTNLRDLLEIARISILEKTGLHNEPK